MLRKLFKGRSDDEAGVSRPLPPNPPPPPAAAPPPPPPPPPSQSSSRSAAPPGFDRLAAYADRVVVVDTETTGVFNKDRVLEVALVTIDMSGQVIEEWDTLIDANRDTGPVWIHGITADMLDGAPAFDDIAGILAARLHGSILCAHNLPFDSRMLTNEFERAGVDVELAGGLDTLWATGVSLEYACSDYGIGLDGAHQALTDARATTELLRHVAYRFDRKPRTARIQSPAPSSALERRLRRDTDDFVVVAPPTFIAELTTRIDRHSGNGDLAPYLELLDAAMADLHLDDDELEALGELAHDLGLDDVQVAAAHKRWVGDLMDRALEDGVVDGDEYDELLRAAHILEVDTSIVRDGTVSHRTTDGEVELVEGAGVCFTGVAVNEYGEEIPRVLLSEHARKLGLVVEDSFTKSRCSLLVAGDASTKSGKAKKARGWGIPVVSAADFLATEPGEATRAQVIAVADRDVLTCQSCGRSFTRQRRGGKKPTECEDCR